MEKSFENILVVGCGGVGGVTAARLRKAGHAVTAVTGNPEIARTIAERGLVASFDDAIHAVELPAHETLSADQIDRPFDLCLLAVPPNAAADAVEDALPLLTDRSPIVCFPNGLIEERLVRQVDVDRLVGGVVGFGARMLGPGKVSQTAAGGVTIGQLPDATDPATTLERVSSVLRDVGPIQVADNLRGARWSKLAINCAISSLGTIGGDRLGTLMRHRFVRRLALETMTEVVDVAVACGVELEKVSGTVDLEWVALDPDERLRSGSVGLLAKHTLLLAVGTKYRNMRSSMLAAIERGRTPPVDFLNGEVVQRGESREIPTPINRALLDTVHAISRGEKSSDVETLRALYDRTRGRLRELDLLAS